MAIPYSRTIFLNIPWYSVLVVTGMIIAVVLAESEQKRKNLPSDSILDAVLWAIPCGIIGARLYYVAMSWDMFRHDLLSILYIWEGGIAIYGGVIGGALAVFLYSRKKKLSCLTLFDCLAPGLLLAQAIGRWGNYFNTEAYGPVIHNPFFQFFPLGVLIPSANGQTWHMATFFYESMWNLTGFGIMWLIRKRQKINGSQFFSYLLWYGSGRFIIEGLRQDSLYIGGIRVSQLLSLLLCLTSALCLFWRIKQKKNKTFFFACISVQLLLLRWLFMDHLPVYLLLMLTGMGLCAAVLLIQRRSQLLLFLSLCLLTDLTSLFLPVLFPSLPVFLGGLHQLVCSLTYSVCVALLCTALSTNE